ncbi:hypothetical protein, partial [Prochlorothrix hollandica]|uniref:hypothetical protein n=1 Tax=Prochlorothrix hollandica TaxID=1223 RepID=UPI0033406519
MAKRRYNEKSLGMGGGISKSDLRNTAAIPIKKKSTGGFKILAKIRLESIHHPERTNYSNPKWIVWCVPGG